MTEAQRLRSEMRRRKLLARSEERMQKVLGTSDEPYQARKPALDSEWVSRANVPLDGLLNRMDEEDEVVKELLPEQQHSNRHSGGTETSTNDSSMPSAVYEGLAFLTGMLSRLIAFPSSFLVSFITLEIAALLPTLRNPPKAPSMFINLWMVLVGNTLSVDVGGSKYFVIVAALEATLQRFLLHSFSFIIFHAVLAAF